MTRLSHNIIWKFASTCSRVHPEDNLWYALSSYERREILDAMRTGVPKRTSGREMQPTEVSKKVEIIFRSSCQ